MPANETVVFREPSVVELRDRSIPEPGPGEFLLESRRSLVSTGTELTISSGDYPEGSVWDESYEYPQYAPGYCTVGTVSTVGGNVEEVSIGDRVIAWKGHERYSVVDRDGWWFPVPDGVSDREAVFLPLAQIVMNGVRRGRVEWGERVALFGLGLMGQLATRFCRIAGATPVIGFDLAPERLDYLPDTPGVVGAVPEDPTDRVRAATNGHFADVVFETTGHPDAIPDQFDVLRDQGRLVVLSSPRGSTQFDFHDYCNFPSYEIIGAHVSSHPSSAVATDPWTMARHAALFFRYLADGDIDLDPLITHDESIARAPETYDELLDDRTGAMGVQFEW